MEQNEPLVRISDNPNLFSVSPEVNTKGFHDAFLRMPLPRPVAKSAYVQAGRILQKADGTGFEYLCAIDGRTGVSIADNLARTPYSLQRTGFNTAEMALVHNHRGMLVLVHNHPNSLPPSYQDVLTASIHDEIKASIIAGHDGSLWYIAAPSAIIAEQLINNYNSIKDDLGDRAELAALEKLKVQRLGKMLDWRKLR